MAVSIRKHVSEPWLRWIKEGRKIYEGRLNRSPWSDYEIGQELVLYSNDSDRIVCVTIEDKTYFRSFGDAFRTYGKELIPEGAETSDDANKMYLRDFGDRGGYFMTSDMVKYGVVVVKIRID